MNRRVVPSLRNGRRNRRAIDRELKGIRIYLGAAIENADVDLRVRPNVGTVRLGGVDGGRHIGDGCDIEFYKIGVGIRPSRQTGVRAARDAHLRRTGAWGYRRIANVFGPIMLVSRSIKGGYPIGKGDETGGTCSIERYG